MLPFPTVRLDGLLQSRHHHPASLKTHSLSLTGNNGDPDSPNRPTPRHVYISPALYVTPQQSPIPEHPSADDPTFPSPYVVNHKRRRATIGTGGTPDLLSGNEEEAELGLNLEVEVVGDNSLDQSSITVEEVGDDDAVDNDEGFLDNTAGSEMENRSFVSDQDGFFDAIEDLYSDASVSDIPGHGSTIQSELCAMKLRIVDEIERRKIAEETIVLMLNQWERISNIISQAGLTFPAPVAGDNMLLEEESSIDQLLQEIIVSRFVVESIGRAEARAEAEEAAANIIESKDHEIARQRDRLRYYETVTHELSQRKLVEVAVRQRQRKRRWRRWMWGFIGFTVSAGASYVAYSYIPRMSRFLSSTETQDSTDRHP